MYFMFGIHPEDSRPLAVTSSLVLDHLSADDAWSVQRQHCDRVIQQLLEQRAARNLAAGGKPLSIPPGSFVYAQCHSVKRNKTSARYFSAPERVEREYPQTLLTQSFNGLFLKRHKKNVKIVHEREAALYDKIPTSVKFAIGFSFTYKDLSRHMDQHTIPDFYKKATMPIQQPSGSNLPSSVSLPSDPMDDFDTADPDAPLDIPPDTFHDTSPPSTSFSNAILPPPPSPSTSSIPSAPASRFPLQDTEFPPRQLRQNRRKKVIFDL